MDETTEQTRVADANKEANDLIFRNKLMEQRDYFRDEVSRLSRVVEQQARLADWIAQILEAHVDGMTHSEKRGALKLIASLMRQYFRAHLGIEVPKFPTDTDNIPF